MSAGNSRPWPTPLADLDALRDWLAEAPVGRSASWHTGNLAADRQQRHVAELEREVLRLARLGLVRPFRVEVRPGVTCYRITRSRPWSPSAR